MSQKYNLRGWCDFRGCKRWNGKYVTSEAGELDYDYLFLDSDLGGPNEYFPENQNNAAGVWNIVGSSRINWYQVGNPQVTGTIEPPFDLYYTDTGLPGGNARRPKPGRGTYYNATGFFFYDWDTPQTVTGNVTCDFYYDDNTPADVISRAVFWKYFPRVNYAVPPRILVVVVTELKLDTTNGTSLTPQYNGALTFGADVGECRVLPSYSFKTGEQFLDDNNTPPLAGRNVFSRSGYDLVSLGFSPLTL